MELWAIRHSASDALLANGTSPNVRENVRGLGDFDADGAADVFSFRANGLHTTDLSIHIVPAPAFAPRAGTVVQRPIGRLPVSF